NSFQGYYRIGDRIVVGEVFGDVYKIDFLTTTVWEVGAPYRPGFVQAEQPTGRLVTFPNNEVLAGTIINLTRDFPYVWDELAIQITNESDMHLALSAMEKATNQLLGQQMIQPSRTYSEILIKAGLDFENVPEKPQVFLSINESWTDVVVRYLVHARERRKWKSRLVLDIWEELNREEYKGKVKAAYSRHQIEMISMTGSAKKFGM
ncbi:MAG: mechanosensitive ion channel domain-containing protein, partial [Cytophagaceae bacterium]